MSHSLALTQAEASRRACAGGGQRRGNIFRVIAVSEAITWMGLLVGMLFKYVLADDERGVQVFGPLHGLMFMAYLVAVLAVRRIFSWSPAVTLVALVCSVPPFASLLFEVWADKTGRLASEETLAAQDLS